MLTNLRVRNFKRLRESEIELAKTVVFIGPNNSGKTTALQALALWELGLKKWNEKRSGKETPEKRPGVTINRRDLITIPVPGANLLWRDLHVRNIQRSNGGQETRNVRIDVTVSGVTEEQVWQCGLEFDYANEESIYCRPLRLSEDKQPERMPVPAVAASIRTAFLPPMSGLAANETMLQEGAINVRIGEGRTAEVLRNLCYQVATESPESWGKLQKHVDRLFGTRLDPPVYIAERGEITMTYRESQSDAQLDLSSSGRGLQQTLLLLAYLYSHPGAALLLDEPDAHLEILRQSQTYQVLTDIAEEQGSQIIAASHSEVILNEAADRDMVISFVGRPHRVDDRGTQTRKALKAIGYEQYYLAEQTGWVIYLEGSTDLAILRAFAETLNHPSRERLERPFAHYVENQPQRARDHFYGLREALPSLSGMALFDRLEQDPPQGTALLEATWRRREIENYLCYPEVLLAYAERPPYERPPAPLFADHRRKTMEDCIADISAALVALGKAKPFTDDIKASDEFLDPLFRRYFETLGLPNLMQKTDYHVLARLVPRELISPEVVEKLGAIEETARKARPVESV